MLAIHYVTLLYSLLLVIFTVKVINTCNIRKYCCERCFKMRHKRTVRGSITHGLTTFLLLCYSRYAQVSLMILIPGTIYRKGRVIVCQVVLYDGEIDFSSSTHLVYAVPALIVCVMLILLPHLLILYPAWYKIFSFLQGIGESKFLGILCRVISIEKLKPILDSFQGSFKDRFRFFAGLYFFYRLFGVIAFAYTSTLKVFYMVVEVQLISMLTVHTLVQPYKKRWHNAIDAILLADLAVINALTYQNSFSSYNTRTITISASIQAILICLPGVYVFMYAIWHILTEMCGIRLKLKCTYCFNIMMHIQATLANCWKKKKNTNEYSDVELQTLYYIQLRTLSDVGRSILSLLAGQFEA